MAGREVDEDAFFGEDGEKHCGRHDHQKLKPYVVLQYLLKVSDADHVVSGQEIADYLKGECGISAERRSIYKDIAAINRVALMLEEEYTIGEAAEILADDEEDESKLVVYDKHKKGFYVRQRHYDLNDIRLLAECVYSAKFVTEGQAKRLVDVCCEFVSEYQAETIRHHTFLTDRVKTNNRAVLNNIAIINDAISRRLDGKPHKPEKISFKYLKCEIGNVENVVERRKGKEYVVDPFHLIINEENYYLLTYNGRAKKGSPIRSYRIDRMRDVKLTGIAREGEDYFRSFDLKNFAQRVFGMYSGEKRCVTIQFANMLLDTAVERFGTKNAQYSKAGDRHFRVTAEVEVSPQFYGWLLGLDTKAKLLYPEDVVEDFKAYIEKVRDSYLK